MSWDLNIAGFRYDIQKGTIHPEGGEPRKATQVDAIMALASSVEVMALAVDRLGSNRLGVAANMGIFEHMDVMLEKALHDLTMGVGGIGDDIERGISQAVDDIERGISQAVDRLLSE